VERLCDRVGIIREGEVVETGTLDQLRHLTRYHINVATGVEMPQLAQVPGVFDLTQTREGEIYRSVFAIDTRRFGEVIAHLNGFDIRKLESTPPSLEELFMKHYEKEVA
jgi:ABC-2 type transport system ATP-binding protein